MAGATAARHVPDTAAASERIGPGVRRAHRPVTGLAAVVFDTAITSARAAAPRTGWRLLIATLVSFGALGGAAIAYPQLLGNGKGPTELALTGSIGLARPRS